MAPKRSTPLEDPPAASSSQEEESSSGEEDDGEEEEGSSSEEEETQGKPQKPSSQPASQIETAKPVHKKPDSESESDDSDSESDSDDDRPNHARDATVKPIASKPMEETPTKTTKPRSKPSASSPATAKSTAAVKRASESDRDPKDSKRRRKKDSESDGVVEKSEDTKKQLFQRLWSEDDEIAVLKGIIDFTKKKGTDPSKDMTSFHDFIKKSLHFDVSLSQLKDKVWRLKKKFENHVSKGKKGENKIFSKAHDQKSFDLSKKIWGTEAISGRGVDLGVKSNGKAKMNGGNNQRSKSFDTLNAEQCLDVEKETEKADKMEVETESHSGLKQIVEFDRTASVAGMEEYVLKRGPDMLEGAKKAEMEEKWRQLHVAELELFLKRNELIREQAKLMLAAYKTE